MSPANKSADADVGDLLKQARDLLDQAIKFVDGDSPNKVPVRRAPQPLSNNQTLDFSVPLRPFIKTHSVGMSGAQKFTLLVAYLAKGDEKKTVSLVDIKREWNKASALLGGKFNLAYPSRARDNDFVETEKAGSYKLRPRWRAILE